MGVVQSISVFLPINPYLTIIILSYNLSMKKDFIASSFRNEFGVNLPMFFFRNQLQQDLCCRLS